MLKRFVVAALLPCSALVACADADEQPDTAPAVEQDLTQTEPAACKGPAPTAEAIEARFLRGAPQASAPTKAELRRRTRLCYPGKTCEPWKSGPPPYDAELSVRFYESREGHVMMGLENGRTSLWGWSYDLTTGKESENLGFLEEGNGIQSLTPLGNFAPSGVIKELSITVGNGCIGFHGKRHVDGDATKVPALHDELLGTLRY